MTQTERNMIEDCQNVGESARQVCDFATAEHFSYRTQSLIQEARERDILERRFSAR